MTNALKVLLFLAGGTTIAATGAYVTGALDPFLNPQPPAAVANVPSGDAASTAGGDATPKEDRVETGEKPAEGQPAAAAQPPAEGAGQQASGEQPAGTSGAATPPASTAGAEQPQDTQIAAVDPNAPASEAKPETTVPAPAGQQPSAPVAGPALPTFDLVRVEANGSMVIAGKAAPDSKIELLTNEAVIGAGAAGGSGDFVVVLDVPLAPGDYQITIRATGKDNAVLTSAQTAIVSIPAKPGGQVLAMIEEPGKPSQIVTVPQPAAATPAEQPAATEEAAAGAATSGETPEPQPSADAGQPKPAETTDVAAAQPQPEAPAASQPQALPAVDVAVEAVEIEGDKVFVAGRAPVGSMVRVYADEIFLGENRASAAGRFLVEAIRDLPVGSYVVRADVMSSDGKVLARAAVPFEREEGENIAAVASQPGSEQGAAKPVDTANAEPASAQEPSAVNPQPATAGEKPAAAADSTQPATGSPATGSPAAGQPVAAEQPAASAPAQPAPAGDNQPATAAAGTDEQTIAGAKPAEVTAPPLQNVKSAVIIRRGDTLWRISKRVYGRGVRYSTIYLANQDQIRDPDMIWPGQVFGVPDRTEEGESADLSRMGEQATTKKK